MASTFRHLVQLQYILLIAVSLLDMSPGYEYCSAEFDAFKHETGVCSIADRPKEDYKHSACFSEYKPENFKTTGQQAKKAEKFLSHCPVSNKFQRIILYLHNDYRNRVAGGEEDNNQGSKYPVAARMRELVWDNELSYLAHLQTSKTVMSHDFCRMSRRYPYSGQNLGFLARNNLSTVWGMVNGSMAEFYIEKNNIKNPVDAVKLLGSTDLVKNTKGQNLMAGHFTALMQDLTGKVGCALALGANCTGTKGKKKYCYYFACHYDMTNMKKWPIYKIGKEPGDSCSDFGLGMSKQYKNLCGNSGEYFDPEEVLTNDGFLKKGRRPQMP